MTADTETIREALERAREASTVGPSLTRGFVSFTAALVALGRIEERERELSLRKQAAMQPWSFHQGSLRERLEWCRIQHLNAADAPIKPLSREDKIDFDLACADWYQEMIDLLDQEYIARAALVGSVAGEEQDLGRASAASRSRERMAEGRAEE